jgi:hypothetical protein
MKLRPGFLCGLLALSGLYGGCLMAGGQKDRPKKIYFNLYTDSIKTALNYYVNVEGEFPNGKILPLDTSIIAFSASNGSMSGNEWIPPKQIDFKTVRFKVWLREDPKISDSIEVWMKQGIDPRDMDLPVEPEEVRKRRR